MHTPLCSISLYPLLSGQGVQDVTVLQIKNLHPYDTKAALPRTVTESLICPPRDMFKLPLLSCNKSGETPSNNAKFTSLS